jgi:HPt (histidine-containing phosphotransfer) domain-containing protein
MPLDSMIAPPAGDLTSAGAALRAIDALGGRALVSEVVDLFMQQCTGAVSAARSAAASSDAPGVASAAHALKSGCGQLGATSLAAEATAMERLARTGESPAPGAIDEFAQRLDVFHQWLAAQEYAHADRR